MRSPVRCVSFVLLALLCVPGLCGADEPLPPPAEPPASAASPAAPPTAPDRDERQLRFRNAAVVGGIVLTVGTYGALQWWDEEMTSKFSTRTEGWFGKGTYAGGTDKLGHAFFGYTVTRLLTSGFDAMGNDRSRSMRLAGWTTFGVLAGIEFVDGFSKKWGFSSEDVVFNGAGVALGLLMEKYPAIDSLLDIRLLHRRSDDSRRKGTLDPLGDYEGQTFLVAVKADGVPLLREVPLVRYLELLVGYNARGFDAEEGAVKFPERRLAYGVGINLARVLEDTVFRGRLKGGKIERVTDGLLEYIQVPGAAALAYEEH